MSKWLLLLLAAVALGRAQDTDFPSDAKDPKVDGGAELLESVLVMSRLTTKSNAAASVVRRVPSVAALRAIGI